MTLAIDVVIVSYNTRAETVACISSLRGASVQGLGRVFVVDNASTDDSVAAVRSAWPDVDVTRLDRNVGFAAANNMALRRATAPLVLLLNPDTIVRAGAIERLRDRLTETGADAAGPRLVDANGNPEMSWGRMLRPWTEAAQSIRVRAASSPASWARSLVGGRVATERWVDWVSGACLLAKRDAVAAAGYFDERYFMYEEDVDLCAALRARGGHILFTPAAEITHLRGRSGSSDVSRAHYHRSHLAFYEKHAPQWVPWLRLWQKK
jgi:GT2 family glycosyltransferase